MIVTYELKINPKPRKPLTAEEIAAIEARAPRDEDIFYDEDCPEMTEEQLKPFQDQVSDVVADLKAQYGEEACAAFGL